MFDKETGRGLVNVAARNPNSGFLRESPARNCSAGNTAQLGVSGGSGDIITVFEESTGKLFEAACGDATGLCLGVVGTSAIQLMECSEPGAAGWRKETSGHRADPLELYS